MAEKYYSLNGVSNPGFIPEIELQEPSVIKKFQEKELSKLLKYLKANSKFYAGLFNENGIDPSKVRKIEDLNLIPPTTKNDLQQKNSEFICTSKNRIIDYITTSGTLGDPVTFGMTENDLERLAYNEFISFVCAGGSADHKYQLMTTIDRRFMAGLAYFLGIRKLGAGIIRVGPGIPELQWDSILHFKPTTLIAVPSFIVRLIDYAEKNSIDYQNSSVRNAVCIGEPLRYNDFSLNTLGRKIFEQWGINLYSTYASTEMAAAFTECRMQHGGHHHPELLIIELLDENNNPVRNGESGELTITTLGVEGMPLLRYKTGDLCTIHEEPCKCGRRTFRLGPVFGRKKQMIKYKGTTIFPGAFYDLLNNFNEVENYYIEVFTNDLGTDEIVVHAGSTFNTEQLYKKLADHFRAKLRVVPRIMIEHPDQVFKVQMPSTSRKPVLFIDNRKGVKI